jgi:hypothetical protein
MRTRARPHQEVSTAGTNAIRPVNRLSHSERFWMSMPAITYIVARFDAQAEKENFTLQGTEYVRSLSSRFEENRSR